MMEQTLKCQDLDDMVRLRSNTGTCTRELCSNIHLPKSFESTIIKLDREPRKSTLKQPFPSVCVLCGRKNVAFVNPREQGHDTLTHP